MALTCLGFPPRSVSEDVNVGDKVSTYDRQERDELISACALAVITLVLFVLAFTFFGVSSLPADVMMGLGIFPFLAGTFLGATGCGVFLGAVASLAIASVRNCQKTAWARLRDG